MASEEVESFVAITAASVEDAQLFIDLAGGNAEQAIQVFFEVGGDVEKAFSRGFFKRPEDPEAKKKRLAEEARIKAEEAARKAAAELDAKMRKAEEKAASQAKLRSLGTSREDRIQRLTLHLLSPAVQMQATGGVDEIPAKLSQDEVGAVFTRLVPDVEKFLYRGQSGQYSFPFMKSVYEKGLQAFRETPVHNHLLWLYRLVVHSGHDDTPGAAILVRQVAEAFQDCQAVQARVIEHAGLQLAGVSLDFRGLVVKLVGEYKILAVKTLAFLEHKDEDADPTHYENRLTADLGDALGLNKNDIQNAELDQHAKSRFTRLTDDQMRSLSQKARELFDFGPFLDAFVAEVNSFSAESPPESLPCLFLKWADENMTQKHVVFDEDTCSHVEVGQQLALAIVEVLLLGVLYAPADELYREEPLRDFFSPEVAFQEPELPTPAVCTRLRIVLEQSITSGKLGAALTEVHAAGVQMKTKVLDEFRKFDTAGNGKLEKDQFASLMREISAEKLTDERIDAMLVAADANHDNLVSVDELVGWAFDEKGNAPPLAAKK